MMISGANAVRLPGKIPLCTRTGREIPNVQDSDLAPDKARKLVEAYRQKFPFVRLRRMPTGQYNCHGMTFAFRRTQITDPAIVEKILQDDGYERIRFRDAQEGDVIVYYEDGEVSHTGIILDVKRDEALIGGRAARVLSKWGPGGEYVHNAGECPYVVPGSEITYWSDRGEHIPGGFSETVVG